jgi:hypothetical protein
MCECGGFCETAGLSEAAEFPHPSTKRRHLLPKGEGTEMRPLLMQINQQFRAAVFRQR